MSPITPTNPVSISKTYDKYWLKAMHVLAPSPTQEAQASLDLVPYNSETGELAPEGLKVNVSFSDIFKRIEEGDTALGSTMSAVLSYAEAEGKRQGKL